MKRGLFNGLTFAAVGAIAVIAMGEFHSAPAVAQGVGIAPGLVLPRMNPVRGKKLFASKGCVVCHSVNGVGGTDAPALDASTMDPVMSPFDFFAKMWRGAEPMIAMQNNELGHQIEFTGQDLADIIAFVHNKAVQRTFSENDIPDEIKKHMEGDGDSGGSSGSTGNMMRGQGGMMGGGGMMGNGGMMGGGSNGQ